MLKVKYLPIRERLIAFLIGSNVMPRAKSTDEFCHGEMYLLYKMMTGLGVLQGIPLASIIIQQMRKAVSYDSEDKTMPFPLFISRILADKGVSLRHENRLATTYTDMITPATLEAMKFFRCHAEWRNPFLQEAHQQPIPDSPPAPPEPQPTQPQGTEYDSGPSNSSAPPPYGPNPLSLSDIYHLCHHTMEHNFQAQQNEITEMKDLLAQQQALLQQQQQQLTQQGELLQRLWSHFHPDA